MTPQLLDISDAMISMQELQSAFPGGIPVTLMTEIQDAAGPRDARELVNQHLQTACPDDPATTVYGRLLWMHMEECRKDFDGPKRALMFELIERFYEAFPAECKVWDDRYGGQNESAKS